MYAPPDAPPQANLALTPALLKALRTEDEQRIIDARMAKVREKKRERREEFFRRRAENMLRTQAENGPPTRENTSPDVDAVRAQPLPLPPGDNGVRAHPQGHSTHGAWERSRNALDTFQAPRRADCDVTAEEDSSVSNSDEGDDRHGRESQIPKDATSETDDIYHHDVHRHARHLHRRHGVHLKRTRQRYSQVAVARDGPFSVDPVETVAHSSTTLDTICAVGRHGMSAAAVGFAVFLTWKHLQKLRKDSVQTIQPQLPPTQVVDVYEPLPEGETMNTLPLNAPRANNGKMGVVNVARQDAPRLLETVRK